MESAEQKFERARQKFRKNMEDVNQRQRRTIFLQEDDIPSTSHQRPREKTRKRTSRTTYTTPTTTARHFRMTVTNPEVYPSMQSPINSAQTACKTSQPSAEPITLSDDEEVIPPPPPYIDPCATEESTSEEPHVGETPPPALWDDECFTLDDLDIRPEDLNDPLIQEFVRTETDFTVDTRPPPPPSPANSFSSLDWENENYRPPTPPRKKIIWHL